MTNASGSRSTFIALTRPAGPHATPEEKEAKISNLKQLLDKGTLTQDEFDQAKATVQAEP
jgi:hypothetical protein